MAISGEDFSAILGQVGYFFGQSFEVLGEAVFIDSPVNITLFDIFVALAFMSIMASFIQWLRGGSIGDSELHGQLSQGRRRRR